MSNAPRVLILVGLLNNGVVSLVTGLVVSDSDADELVLLDFERKT
jgi:hypothetical protein